MAVGPDLALVMVTGGVRYLMGNYREPAIFPVFLAMDARDPLEIWVELNHNRRSRHGTSLRKHPFIVIGEHSESARW